jgi:hypothetical protein
MRRRRNSRTRRNSASDSTPEYFAFAAKERQALPICALGQEVQFVLDGTVYEITK